MKKSETTPPPTLHKLAVTMAEAEKMYKNYYPPLLKNSEGRYLLDFVINSDGSVDDKSAALINGHCPWPNNSPFLQIIEMASQEKIIDMSDINTFFECGTSQGQTACAMSAFFRVETVEALPEVYEANKDKKGLKYPINYHLGHGPDILREYLIKNPNERMLILLDDHDSDLSAWIEEELIIIKRHSNRNDHLIILDDLDHCGLGTYPYSISLVYEMCLNINPLYQVVQVSAPDILPFCKGVFLAAPLLPGQPRRGLQRV